MSDFLTALRDRVLVLDGAMGTNIHRLDLSVDDFGGAALEGCPEILNVLRPDAIAGIHDGFLRVGCDAIETNTFGAFSIVLSEYGIEGRAYELAKAGAEIALGV